MSDGTLANGLRDIAVALDDMRFAAEAETCRQAADAIEAMWKESVKGERRLREIREHASGGNPAGLAPQVRLAIIAALVDEALGRPAGRTGA